MLLDVPNQIQEILSSYIVRETIQESILKSFDPWARQSVGISFGTQHHNRAVGVVRGGTRVLSRKRVREETDSGENPRGVRDTGRGRRLLSTEPRHPTDRKDLECEGAENGGFMSPVFP